MSNLYITPMELRRALKLDTQNAMPVSELEPLLRSTCRYIDNTLGRHFYSVTDTRTYDGPGGTEWWLPDDVISITSLKWDADEDETYGTTLTEGTDFRGWPYNGDHYRRLDVWGANSNVISSWPTKRKSLQIVGKFGWSEETVATGDTVEDNPLSDSATTITVNNEDNFEVGMTLLIESEQVYVEAVTSDDSHTLTVKRAVNGTTAASHAQNTAIFRFEYAGGAVRNEIMAAATRWYTQYATGFVGMLQNMNENGYASFRAMYPAIMDGLATYRHPADFAGVV